MSVSRYKVKKWADMLLGKSIHHVNQNEGKIYSVDSVKGYYNNLIEKVTMLNISDDTIPKSFIDSGEKIYFSIEIFQYGLAAYDLYLLNDDEKMRLKAIACAEWAVSNQNENGSWPTFDFDNPTHPYSSMAQGEGISLLTRAFVATNDNKYLESASRAEQFMLLPLEKGGTTKYQGEELYFYERTGDPLVLNGWIFSYWGLLDYWKITKDVQANCVLNKSLQTMIRVLPSFDIGYWSKYDTGKMISSPFYHRLHIAQLNVMYDLTKESIFKLYADRWMAYHNSFMNRMRAFVVKA